MDDQLVWQEEYNIGVEIIDKEHQRLFKIINKLFMVDGEEEEEKSRWVCQEGIKYFKGHTLKHFVDEEKYMESIGYEGLKRHRHIHRNFRENILPALEEELEKSAAPVHAAPEKKFGYVAVCAGAGLEAVFQDLGVDGLVGGGQTMNPSTQDILKAIDATPAEIVYVLPNNKNIIMAAEQTIPLCEDKKVVVLPTKTVPQGISAMLCADPDASEEDNTAAMAEGFANVRTSEVTYAARDSDFDGFAIHQGDYLALEEHQLFGTDQDLSAILDRLARSDAHQNAEFISIFYGEDVSEEQAQEAEKIFAAACPSAEITLLAGGQPVYYFMISAE